MKEVKEITDYKIWDDFVEGSSQGTIFSTTRWMRLFGEFKIYGYYRNGELTGGIAGFEHWINKLGTFLSGATLTPFQGVITHEPKDAKYTTIIALNNEISLELKTHLESIYSVIRISNHYMFPDVRSFAGYKHEIKYTYVVNLSNMATLWGELDKDTRNYINHTKVRLARGVSPEAFYKLYQDMFTRKGMEPPISLEFIKNLYADLGIGYSAWGDDLLAASIVIYDRKRAYYILAASQPVNVTNYLMWEIFKDLAGMGHKEIDLVGANDPKIDLFKRGFGGRLMPYYRIETGGIVK